MLPSTTPTLTTFTPVATGTSELSILMNATATSYVRPTLTSKFGNDWPSGCWGIVLIILGVLLAWIINRRTSRPLTRKQYFKMR